MTPADSFSLLCFYCREPIEEAADVEVAGPHGGEQTLRHLCKGCANRRREDARRLYAALHPGPVRTRRDD